MGEVVASVCDGRICVSFRYAPPLTLHGENLPRTDGNSPVSIGSDNSTTYYSHYLPNGHSYRRQGTRNLEFDRTPVPIRFVDDTDPATGKWLEAVWPGPDSLYGLFHAEVLASCERRLFIPDIRIGSSQDNGLSWKLRGTILRAPDKQADCSYRNGFFAGGFGDLSALTDRAQQFLYIAFTSFVADETAQGIAMARLRCADPTGIVELWTRDGWTPGRGGEDLPQPVWPMRRGWRYADPDGFWGAAIHYNRRLDAYVMLLNHTAGGNGDLVQEGIYASINTDVANPHGWSEPVRIVSGGAWYPQAVGLEPGDSDTHVTGLARFFMAGYSAWTIEFSPAERDSIVTQPLLPTKAMFAQLFGTRHAAPW